MNPCRVCVHEERETINRELSRRAPTTFRALESYFKISKSSIHRHRHAHIAPAWISAQREMELLTHRSPARNALQCQLERELIQRGFVDEIALGLSVYFDPTSEDDIRRIVADVEKRDKNNNSLAAYLANSAERVSQALRAGAGSFFSKKAL
jgi:hypothetical protein